MDREFNCPKCGRRYRMDSCLGKSFETVASENVKRRHCAYCQDPYSFLKIEPEER